MGRYRLEEKKKKGLSIYLEKDLIGKLAIKASAEDRSISYVVSKILREAFKKKGATT